MDTITVYPALNKSVEPPVSRVVYAADLVTVIPASGAIVPKTQYYLDLLACGSLLPYNPLNTGGDPVEILLGTAGALGITTTQLSSLPIRQSGHVVTTTGYARSGDGGEATFEGCPGVSAGADGITKINASNGQWQLSSKLWFDARWFGAKPDGRIVTVNVSGTAVSGAPAGTWDSSCVGHKVLVEAPSQSIGTVSFTSGSTTATGSGFSASVPCYSYSPTIPSGGGGLIVNGVKHVIFRVTSDTQLRLLNAAASTTSGTGYIELQHTSTITSVLPDGSGFTMADAAPVAVNGVSCFTASDSADAWAAAWAAAAATGGEVFGPPGIYGVSKNISFTSYQNVVANLYGVVLKDLRKATTQYDFVGGATDNMAMWTFFYPRRIRIRGLSVDGSIPVRGTGISSGGMANGNGGRLGIVFRNFADCSFEDCKPYGFGTRSEYFYADGNYSAVDAATGEIPWCRDVAWRNCDLTSNCNTVNPGSGYIERAVIDGCRLKSLSWSALLCSAKEASITNTMFEGDPTLNTGADLVAIDTSTKVLMNGFTIHKANMTGYTSSPLAIFTTYDFDANVEICNGVIQDISGSFHLAAAGVVRINNYSGTSLKNVRISRITCASSGGVHVFVSGAYTDNLTLENLTGDASTNMTVGVRIDATVPHDAVTVRRCSFQGVTTPIDNPSNIRLRELVVEYAPTTVSASSATIACGFNVVDVTYNGACAVTLWPAETTPGFEVTVRNASAQLGTTTVSASSGSVVGGNTVVGAEKCRRYRAIGTSWQCVSSI